MRLTTSNGSTFELTILGSQFPEMDTEEYDSNWLRIQIDVTHPRGRWTAIDPMLLTYEVAQLADWLTDISSGRRSAPDCGFIEPNLEFRLVDTRDNEKRLRILFELEARPTWAPAGAAGMEDLWLDFPVNELDLHRAALALHEQLEHFPQRADR